MALEAFMDSRYPLALDSKSSTQMSGDFIQSSNSGAQQKAEQIQAVVASLFSASSGNFLGASANIPYSNTCVVSSANPTTLNGLTNLGLSVGAEVHSAVLEGPHMHRSATIKTDQLNLPALPWFSSHNSSISASPATSDSSIMQQDSQVGQNCSRICKRKRQQEGIFTKSQSGLRNSQNSIPDAEKQEFSSSKEMHNRPRPEVKQDAILYHHNIQQPLQSQDNKELQEHSPVLETLIQQHKLENHKQQKILQPVLELQGVDLKKQRQQQIRDYLQQLALQEVHHIHSFNGNLCSRRLTQYMYHLQHRPPDNGIAYWRKFVAEYYAPCAKKKWCLSSCDDFTAHADCIFPRAAVDAWQCGLCRTKCEKGFEATVETLPRLKKILFESGVIDELLFLELPHEDRLPSGFMTLECERAVHETVFDKLHVVREGKLRVVFTLDLKILSWEFCSRNHEELLRRSSIASQVNEFVQAAQVFQMTINSSGSDNISTHNLKENHNKLLSTGCKLQRNLDMQVVSELGFSKRYIRCLQIAEVLNSMKDLMTHSWENKIGPIESMKNYTQKIISTKIKKDEYKEKEKLEISQGMPSDTSMFSSISHTLSSNKNDNSNASKDRSLTSSEKAALMHAGDYCKLLRQNSVNLTGSKLVESSSPYKGTNQCTSSEPFESPKIMSPEFSQNLLMSNSHLPGSYSNPQELMIQKLLQEMINNSRAANWAENGPAKSSFHGL